MERKILTVVVPCYNMEHCLEKNLESYVKTKNKEKLSVTVIDNSSQDGSFSIAKKFESLYPDVFTAIRKENKGYGSSVNLGIKLSLTKYLRVVDADDSVCPSELESFLKHLEGCDADVVQTPYLEVDIKTGEEKAVDLKTEFGKSLPQSAVTKQTPTPSLHSSTFKTELLRENGINLTENAYFADEELATYPFFFAKTLTAFNDRVYRYSVNGENQSTSRANRIKYLYHREAVVKRMMQFYERANIKRENEEYSKSRVALAVGNHFTSLYILHPKRRLGKALAKNFAEYLKENHPIFYRATYPKRVILAVLNFLRITPESYEKLKKRLMGRRRRRA